MYRRSGAPPGATIISYATVAGQNVETLNRYQPRRIITQCPHCFHNLKNEYPDFGGNYQVMHEAEFLDQPIKSGRLKPRNAVNERITYHDPCYMARHNRQWDGARNALRAIPGTEVEGRRSVEESYILLRRGWRLHVEGRA